MSTEFKFEHHSDESNLHGKVNVSDLIFRMNKEKKIEKKKKFSSGCGSSLSSDSIWDYFNSIIQHNFTIINY